MLNGSGAYNQATDTAAALGALGFHIGTIGDSPPVGQEAETVVYYSSKTPAELAAAQAVANSISGAVIMAEDPTQAHPGSQVTVVTGTDFSVNPPAVAPAESTAGAGTTGGTGAGAAGSGTAAASTTAPTAATNAASQAGGGAFAAPTRTVEPLAPWTRSCTPSGGEGP